MIEHINPDDFVIIRRRKKYKFAKFHNAEVEFKGRETEATLRADTFQPPEWFGEDISSNPSYKNRSLASHSPHSPMNLSDISM